MGNPSKHITTDAENLTDKIRFIPFIRCYIALSKHITTDAQNLTDINPVNSLYPLLYLAAVSI